MATVRGFALFDTAVGRCGIAWSEVGIAAVQLPEATEEATRARLRRRFREAREASPPPAVGRAIDAILALLAGEESDLSPVALDMDGLPPFDRSVYELARTVPRGETTTYGEIAARLGDPGSARAVGGALGRNPFPIVVPCHRVLAAGGGGLGGFSAAGGVATKRRLLYLEGSRAVQPTLFGDDTDDGLG